MTAPNESTLWGRTLVEEFERAGVSAACVAPGSRSTPLVVALAESEIEVHSHLDERSAAFFALGRAKRTGEPTPLVCTSGTAAANFHPAVIEADRSRVPMLVLTADRPPELHGSGANQTVDQAELYGDATRWYRTLPEPGSDARALRSLRTTVARALAASTGTPPGPVHLNVPFRKPLEPTPAGTVPDSLADDHPRAAAGRDGPYVRTAAGRLTLDGDELAGVVEAVEDAERGLIVAGPAPGPEPDALAALARSMAVPVLADPLSGARFGPHVGSVTVCGGYDSYLDPTVVEGWPDPDLVVRFGASPTSKTLREYVERADPRQLLVDPAGAVGGWREASFSATDLVVADPSWLARRLAERVDGEPGPWTDRFARAEARYWDLVAGESADFEGRALATVVEGAPDPATVFVSNSMPVRDLDRFGRPSTTGLAVLGNRGASGIDGITSAALGAGSATDDPLVLVTGDVAYYHDMNGLLAVGRCGVDATIVEINNDGGGIFHMLPIEAFDPPFTDWFKTPHGLDFSPTAELYGLEFERVGSIDALEEAYRGSLASDGTQVIEFAVDAEASHRTRERLHDRVCDELGR